MRGFGPLPEAVDSQGGKLDPVEDVSAGPLRRIASEIDRRAGERTEALRPPAGQRRSRSYSIRCVKVDPRFIKPDLPIVSAPGVRRACWRSELRSRPSPEERDELPAVRTAK